ncbi:MAG: TIGR03915 family putative DNA repair protein [Oscillospiraceae bacterium]
MYRRENVTYLYDASFDGFLCCVHESVYAKEIPAEIMPENDYISSFFPPKYIALNRQYAKSVYNSLQIKISCEAQELVQSVFFSCMPQKELSILLFLLWAYRNGSRVMGFVAHPLLQPLLAADNALRHEAHLFLGFSRFEDVGGALVAVIEPKNYVLPYIAEHFCTRFANENFLIYDKTHSIALIWQDGKAEMQELDSLAVPPCSISEKRYQSLWKQFYKTIAIKSRENPFCRRTHCPKRYWKQMLEMPK